jgi:15-cis-phytoene synthase
MIPLMTTTDTGVSLWERRLLGRAYAAHDCLGTGTGLDVDPRELKVAYEASVEVTAKVSRTFYMASGLLPAAKRWFARSLYAFCRVSDDLVDCGEDAVRGDLAHWRQTTLAAWPPLNDPVAVAWADTRARVGIPTCLIEQFFDGVAADQRRVRYETFDELAEYAYGVASTVGLMVMHVIGFSGPEAIPYAVKLGVALQLTNILRDVAEDWQAGRLYLPQEELDRFGLSEADIAAGHIDDRWRAFMVFQIARNRRLYAEAAPGIPMLHSDGRMAIQAAADLYAAILDDIEAHDGDVFSRRAHIGTWGKLRRLPGIWWRSRRDAGSRHPDTELDTWSAVRES